MTEHPDSPEDILKGLRNFDPEYPPYKANLTSTIHLALHQDTPMNRLVLKEFLDGYKNETRLIRTVDESDMNGRNALHWTVGTNNTKGYTTMLKLGADINHKTWDEGFTPLMVACRKQVNPKVAKYLLEHKADVSIKANNSATAFHIATAFGSRDCMRLLVVHGCDPFVPLKDGRTAIDLAEEEATKKVVYYCYRTAAIREEKSGKVCAHCGKASTKLDRCGQCYVTFYCSRRCQVDHWKAEHREQCKGSAIAEIEKQDETVSKSEDREGSSQEKAIIVMLTVQTEDGENLPDINVYNEERNLHGLLKPSPEKNSEVLQHIRSFNRKVFYCWAKESSEKQKLRVFHSSPLPICQPGRYDEPESEREETSDE